MKRILIGLAILLMALPAFAGNVVKDNGRTIAITAMDSDWDLGKVIGVAYVLFTPGGAADVLVLRDGVGGPQVVDVTVSGTDNEQLVSFNGAKMWPAIDYSECTLTAGFVITIKYAD